MERYDLNMKNILNVNIKADQSVIRFYCVSPF